MATLYAMQVVLGLPHSSEMQDPSQTPSLPSFYVSIGANLVELWEDLDRTIRGWRWPRLVGP